MDNKDVELTKTIKSGQQQQIVCIQKSGFGSHCMNNLPPPPKYYLKSGMKHMCIDGYCWLAADVGTEFLVRTEMFSPPKKNCIPFLFRKRPVGVWGGGGGLSQLLVVIKRMPFISICLEHTYTFFWRGLIIYACLSVCLTAMPCICLYGNQLLLHTHSKYFEIFL